MKRHLILALVSLLSVACVVEEEPFTEQEPAEDAPAMDDDAAPDHDVEPLPTLQPGEPMDAPAGAEAELTAACEADEDCGEDAWCGQDAEGSAMCRVYKEQGESCGSYSLPGMADRCAAGLVCVTDPQLPDLPGLCELEADS